MSYVVIDFTNSLFLFSFSLFPPVENTLLKRVNEEDKAVLRAQIGSRPPRCDGRCSSCGHCEAIQVPTNPQTGSRAGSRSSSTAVPVIAYARGDDNSNYKPMSWKCKCGNLIFNP
ncbi:UNVERIFIED_CONTAM: EPIDERMAL PATTERNING FACTOR-like protein 2 [Sesamum radiatum]|uniref:Epidermal patterning factor-like protein n=1 Tax=Sesamum radiatum TaxID=300843 RepID=A0AAW2VNV3_SESRA